MSVLGSLSTAAHASKESVTPSSTLPPFHTQPKHHHHVIPAHHSERSTNRHGTLDASSSSSPSYHRTALLRTLSRAPFKTYCDVGSLQHQKTLLRGRYEGLCDGDASHRQHAEPFEYFDLVGITSSHDTAARAEDGTAFAPDKTSAMSAPGRSSDLDEDHVGRHEEENAEEEGNEEAQEEEENHYPVTPARPQGGTSSPASASTAAAAVRVAVRVEPYHRSAAGKAVDVRTMRTTQALEKSMHFLVEHYLRHPHTALIFTDPFKIWLYLWDRLRGIRTTWIPQLPLTCSRAGGEELVDASSGQVLAMRQLHRESRRRVRWLEFTVAALAVGAAYLCLTPDGCRRFVLEKKNFLESISQCFTDLAVSYRAEQRARNAEFLSVVLLLYGLKQEVKAEDRALFCSFRQEVVNGVETLCAELPGASVNLAQVYKELERQPRLAATRPVRMALQLLHCWSAREWDRFFYLCRHGKLTTLQRCVVFQSFTYARFRAVLDLVVPNAYVYTKLRLRGSMPVCELAELLMMTEADCVAFVQHMGLSRLLDDTQRVLQLSNDRSESLVLADEIEASCASKQNLLFPTDGCYLGFRVWHEMWRRFPNAPFGCEAEVSDTAGKAEEETMRAEEAHASRDGHRAGADAEGWEREGENEESRRGGLCATAADATTTTSRAVPESVLLRRPHCPVDWMCILEPYCPPYGDDLRAVRLVDAPEELFAHIPAHRRAAQQRAQRCRHRRRCSPDDKQSRRADHRTAVSAERAHVPHSHASRTALTRAPESGGALREDEQQEEEKEEEYDAAGFDAESLSTRTSVFSDGDMSLPEMEQAHTEAYTNEEEEVEAESAAAEQAEQAEMTLLVLHNTTNAESTDSGEASAPTWAPWLASVAEARALQAQMLRQPLYASLNPNHTTTAEAVCHEKDGTCEAGVMKNDTQQDASPQRGAVRHDSSEHTPSQTCAAMPAHKSSVLTHASMTAAWSPLPPVLAPVHRRNEPDRRAEESHCAHDRVGHGDGHANTHPNEQKKTGGVWGERKETDEVGHDATPTRRTPSPASVSSASLASTSLSDTASSASSRADTPPRAPAPLLLSSSPSFTHNHRTLVQAALSKEEGMHSLSSPAPTALAVTQPSFLEPSGTSAMHPTQATGRATREGDSTFLVAPSAKTSVPHAPNAASSSATTTTTATSATVTSLVNDETGLSGGSSIHAALLSAVQTRTHTHDEASANKVETEVRTSARVAEARAASPTSRQSTHHDAHSIARDAASHARAAALPARTPTRVLLEHASSTHTADIIPPCRVTDKDTEHSTADALPHTPSSVSLVSRRSSSPTYTQPSRNVSPYDDHINRGEDEHETRVVHAHTCHTHPSAVNSVPPCVTMHSDAAQAVMRYLVHVWELLIHGRSAPYLPCHAYSTTHTCAPERAALSRHAAHSGVAGRGNSASHHTRTHVSYMSCNDSDDDDDDVMHVHKGYSSPLVAPCNEESRLGEYNARYRYSAATRAEVRFALADALLQSTTTHTHTPIALHTTEDRPHSSCTLAHVRRQRHRLARRLCRGFTLALRDTASAEAQSATAAAQARTTTWTATQQKDTMRCVREAHHVLRQQQQASQTPSGDTWWRAWGHSASANAHARWAEKSAHAHRVMADVRRWSTLSNGAALFSNHINTNHGNDEDNEAFHSSSDTRSTIQLISAWVLPVLPQTVEKRIDDTCDRAETLAICPDVSAVHRTDAHVCQEALWHTLGIPAAVMYSAASRPSVALARVGAQEEWSRLVCDARVSAAEAQRVLTSVHLYAAATPMPERWTVRAGDASDGRTTRPTATTVTQPLAPDAENRPQHEHPFDTHMNKEGVGESDTNTTLATRASLDSVTMIFCVTSASSLTEVVRSVTTAAADGVAGVLLLLLAAEHDGSTNSTLPEAVTERFWRLYHASRAKRVAVRPGAALQMITPAAGRVCKRARCGAFRSLSDGLYQPTPAAAWQPTMRRHHDDEDEEECAGERPVLVVMPCELHTMNEAVVAGMAALLEAYRTQLVQRCRVSDVVLHVAQPVSRSSATRKYTRMRDVDALVQ